MRSAESSRSVWPVVAVATVVSTLILLNSLSAFAWNPTTFVGFGEDAIATTEYGQERLGAVVLRDQQGHDGKFFFIQANDPWLLDPSEHAELVDPPVYRSRRMLYPAFAGLMGFASPGVIVWNLVVVNVIGMALGTLAAARLARLLGGSVWWGLAFGLNFGLIFDLMNDGAGVIAACLAMWAVLMLYQQRYGWAVWLMAGAVLSREVMLVTAVGAAAWHWSKGRRRVALGTVLIPGAAIAAWTLYITARLGSDTTSVGAFSLPFVGLARAFPYWAEDPAVLATGCAMLLLMVLYVLRWAQSRTALGWSYVGFVAVAVLMSDKVWRYPFDFARSLAPLITAAILLIFVEVTNRTRDRDPSELAPSSAG